MTFMSANADLIVSESFNYTSGSTLIQGVGSGTGFSTNWVAGGRNTTGSSMRVQSGSLQFIGVDSEANSVTGISSNDGIFGTNRQTNQNFVGASNGQTSWMSFLIRQNSIGGQFGGFGGIYIGNSTSENDPKLFIGKGGVGANNWLIENLGGSGTVQSTTAVSTGETALLVLKMETFNGNDRFTLYVNPSAEAAPTIGFAKTDLDLASADRITMYHAGSFAFDEIRIGTSYFDVVTAVPEPSSALLFFAGLTLTSFRMRRFVLANP